MSVLVLHRGQLAASPYDRWLHDYDGDVLLLVAHEPLERFAEELPGDGRYKHVESVSDYDVSGYLEARALELARAHGVQHIVATQERDLERAAQLREILGLPGQRLESAAAFRNKVLMKARLREAGIPVAAHAELECAADLLAFAESAGFPVVLKPRNGAGSVDLRIVAGPEELEALLLGDDVFAERLAPNLIAEASVAGAMCHVDGLILGGQIVFAWASQYLYALSSFRSDPHGRLDVALDQDDPLAHRLLDLVGRALAVLPGPTEFGFHAEVFHTPQDALLMCEIACRPGGAAIRDVGRALFGADLAECLVRAQVGLHVAVAQMPLALIARQAAGQLVLMKRPGKVVSVPHRPPFSWVEQARVFVAPGQVMSEAANSADFMASYVVSAPSRRECEARLRELDAWFQARTVIEAEVPV